MKRLLLLALLMQCALASAIADDGHVQVTRARVLQQTKIPVYTYTVVASYPHDRTAYTEGLVYLDGAIYEGTGLYGRSGVREWDLRTGRVRHEAKLDPHFFGEGVTVLDSKVFELTYLGNTGFVYDQSTFDRRDSFRFVTQGWGLTNDGKRLIMSDGSSAILFLDPQTREVTGHVFVTDDVGPVGFLNELEYVDGILYANVWQTDFIAMIQPDSGKIVGWIDLTGLNPEPKTLVYPYVLNGIAWRPETKHLLVTGKCWPHLYEIALAPRAH